jgi:hypothetical protein
VWLAFLSYMPFFACSIKNQVNEDKIFYNGGVLEKYMVADKIILVTCTRCGCFVDAINNLKNEDYKYVSSFPILADSNCNRLNIPSHYIHRKVIDSISTDLYNIVLIKRSNGHYEFNILSLSQSANIALAMRNYFGD